MTKKTKHELVSQLWLSEKKMRANAIIRDFIEPFEWFICKSVCKSQKRDWELRVLHAHDTRISCDANVMLWLSRSPLYHIFCFVIYATIFHTLISPTFCEHDTYQIQADDYIIINLKPDAI